jgi:hypothetical protein
MTKRTPTTLIGKLQRRIVKRAADISFLEYVAQCNKHMARLHDEKGYFDQADGYYAEAASIRREIKALADDQRIDRGAIGGLYEGQYMSFMMHAETGVVLDIPGYSLPKDFDF